MIKSIDKGDELCSKPEELVLHILAHDYDRLLYSIFVLVMSHYPSGTFYGVSSEYSLLIMQIKKKKECILWRKFRIFSCRYLPTIM